MKDEKQLVLFLRKGIQVDGAHLASKFCDKFSILGQPAVIPYDPRRIDQPLVIFNQGPISLTVGVSDVSFIYDGEKHKEYYDTIIEMIEFFEYLDYSFDRMGYVSTYFHSKKDREKFKETMFKDPSKLESEFQFSWYSKELIDSVSVNVWRRAMTDLMNKVDLVSVYDINTPIDEAYNISSEFLSDFIKKCDKFIENKEKESF